MIDIDDFKAVDDAYGYHVGDQVFRSVSESLASRVRSSDVMGRYGGDVFFIIAEVFEESEPYALAERLLHAIERNPSRPIREASRSPSAWVHHWPSPESARVPIP